MGQDLAENSGTLTHNIYYRKTRKKNANIIMEGDNPVNILSALL